MLAELVESHRIHVPQFPVAFRPRSSPRRCAGRPELHAAQCTKLLRPRRRIRRPSHTQQNNRTISCSGWWFGTCFIFHNIWDNPSHWLSYFSRWLKPPTRLSFSRAKHENLVNILKSPEGSLLIFQEHQRASDRARELWKLVIWVVFSRTT